MKTRRVRSVVAREFQTYRAFQRPELRLSDGTMFRSIVKQKNSATKGKERFIFTHKNGELNTLCNICEKTRGTTQLVMKSVVMFLTNFYYSTAIIMN
ncbi:hypothetical protein TcasGA2_TC008902 [Tribolium castaneum]|uniref:Uncharacterized protein n=1 Tax=Tribolium castaneum TaxID=7070 RepID=D6WQI9_TRICA|nr:hypothetical protein TcasGA2_TC008902 [Tribolium castaneum]